LLDQATTEAEKLRHWLDGAAAEIKKRLGLEHSLSISTLRGRHLDNREWLGDPSGPAIIVGTVDMIGSRLLFSGYGVNRKMRPYHAGLLGADTLAVLDEAHLVPPFEALMRAIACDRNQFGPRSAEDLKIVPPLRLMALSATGREREEKNGCKESGQITQHEPVFRLNADDRLHPIVIQRLNAPKKLTIHDAFNDNTSLADELAERACTLVALSKPARVLIYCDRRRDAVKVKATIDKRMKSDGLSSELLIGQRRLHEQEELLSWLNDRGFIEGPVAATAPAFLIATSAGEVGIDLDADHMVCDLVEWERMVQRLGRVNRRGCKDSRVEVVALPSKDDKKHSESWVERLKRLRAPLDLLPVMECGRKDASPGAIAALKDKPAAADALRRAQTPEPLRPLLTRALVDAWSMTSLENYAGRPEIQPWLRGWEEDEEQQATIIWRSHLPTRIQNGRAVMPLKNEINEFFEAAPPHLSEMLETETWRAAEWIFGRIKAVWADTGKPAHEGNPGALSKDRAVLFVLNAKDELEVDERGRSQMWTLRRLAELGNKEREREKKAFIRSLNGRTLVVSAYLGGLRHGVLRDEEGAAALSMDTDAYWSLRPFRVSETRRLESTTEVGWKQSYLFASEIEEDGEATRWLVIDERQGESEGEEFRALSRNEQKLEDHRQATKKIALEFAKAIGLPPRCAEMLAVAALLHDEGKDCWRWQRAFNARPDGPYAKTVGPVNLKLLDGYRHELGSLLKVERHPELRNVSPDLHDLLLHLVASLARESSDVRGQRRMPRDRAHDSRRSL
jgi:CRISPR-associated endonuclease/helicase Cas3